MNAFGEAVHLLVTFDPEIWQIIGTTLQMTLTSTLISTVIGVLAGVLLGTKEFPCKRLVMRIVNTLMSLPPVVAGLFVYLLLSYSGPLGQLKLLYTLPAMVIAQVILITPIITGLVAAAVGEKAETVHETCLGLGIRGSREKLLLLGECRNPVFAAIVTGFGRAMSEVGAIVLVGGNIQHKTRVMTSAIMLETNKGKFGYSIALGIMLLLISFIINYVMHRFKEKG